MRGVAGSGKSTTARILAGTGGVIHSTDDYFYDTDGLYRFDPSLLRENHDKNFTAFCESLRKGIHTVICDNTNAKYWQWKKYAKAAENAEYRVVYVEMPHPTPEMAVTRTSHSVPIETIREMIRGWEPTNMARR